MYCAASKSSPASFQIVLHEARVVRSAFESLVREQKSIHGIARELNAQGIPARHGGPWARSTIGHMLRNPAYMGKAAFGKTRSIERTPTRLRPIRGKSMTTSRGIHRRPPQEWISIDVPPIVSSELFAAVAEQLTRNKALSQRRARAERYLLQGLIVCACCGYTCYGTAVNKKSKRLYSYYRCSGADAGRFPGGRVCRVSPVRADLLHEHVWRSVSDLLQEPERLKEEWLRRANDKKAGSELLTQRNESARLLATQEKTLQRLVDAYEVGALSLEDLKRRTDMLRQRIDRTRRELHDAQQRFDHCLQLRAIITRLEDFAARVSTHLERLSWEEQQRLIRTLITRIEISEDAATIVYRLSAPAGPGGSNSGGGKTSYGLCPSEQRDEPVGDG